MFRFTSQNALFLALMVALPASLANAQDDTDPTGKWTWEWPVNGNVLVLTLNITKDDDGKLAGTTAVMRGENELRTKEAENLKVDGNKLTFQTKRSYQGNEINIDYDGVVTGDSIKGFTVMRAGGQEREREWTAKRAGKSGPAWTTLFDGKTLEGWERVGNEDSKWMVEDGAMTARGPASMLVNTTGPYKNFRYRAECKISDGGNSGLYFRTTRKPGFMDGYEAQIDSTHTDPIRTGSLYGMCHVYKQHVKPDTWFTYDLEVRDDVWRGRKATLVKISIDGNELYEYMDFELTFKQGHFAFQHHDPESIVHIRKVEVMPLAD